MDQPLMGYWCKLVKDQIAYFWTELNILKINGLYKTINILGYFFSHIYFSLILMVYCSARRVMQDLRDLLGE